MLLKQDAWKSGQQDGENQWLVHYAYVIVCCDVFHGYD